MVSSQPCSFATVKSQRDFNLDLLVSSQPCSFAIEHDQFNYLIICRWPDFLTDISSTGISSINQELTNKVLGVPLTVEYKDVIALCKKNQSEGIIEENEKKNESPSWKTSSLQPDVFLFFNLYCMSMQWIFYTFVFSRKTYIFTKSSLI